MCVESHLREFLEQGFEVAVVKDAWFLKYQKGAKFRADQRMSLLNL